MPTTLTQSRPCRPRVCLRPGKASNAVAWPPPASRCSRTPAAPRPFEEFRREAHQISTTSMLIATPPQNTQRLATTVAGANLAGLPQGGRRDGCDGSIWIRFRQRPGVPASGHRAALAWICGPVCERPTPTTPRAPGEGANRPLLGVWPLNFLKRSQPAHHDGAHLVAAGHKAHRRAGTKGSRPRPVGRLSAAQVVTSAEPPPERVYRVTQMSASGIDDPEPWWWKWPPRIPMRALDILAGGRG